MEMHWELEEILGNLIRSLWELDGNIIIKRKNTKNPHPNPYPQPLKK
jgi:hypothetical protein